MSTCISNAFIQVIRCYELAGDLTLLYLQEADRASRRGHTQSTLSMAAVTSSTLSPHNHTFEPRGLLNSSTGHLT